MSVHHGVELRPIAPADVRAVARFLHDKLNSRVPIAGWAQALGTSWSASAPNHGFLLSTEAEGIVGVYLAFYSERRFEGGAVRICNLAAWCVAEDFRAHSLRLLRALLAQKGFEFTDLSPSGNVIALNTRLKFASLDTRTDMVANLPWLLSRTVQVISDPAEIGRTLEGRNLEIFRDHETAAAARHLVLQRGTESCYVIYRRDRRKRLPLFASILYVSDPALFQTTARHAYRHLLLRHGVLVTLAERRVTGGSPGPSAVLTSPRPKMYRSDVLRPDQIDYLYSELTCVPW